MRPSALTVAVALGALVASSACKPRQDLSAVRSESAAEIDDVETVLLSLTASTRQLASDLAMDQRMFDDMPSVEGLALADDPDASLPPEVIAAKISALQLEFNALVSAYDGQKNDRITAIVADLERLKAVLPAATPKQQQQASQTLQAVSATQVKLNQQVVTPAETQQSQQSGAQVTKGAPANYSGVGPKTFLINWPRGMATVQTTKSGKQNLSVTIDEVDGTTLGYFTNSLVFNDYRRNSNRRSLLVSGGQLKVTVSTTPETSWTIRIDGPRTEGEGPLGTWDISNNVVTAARFFKKGTVVKVGGNYSISGSAYISGYLFKIDNPLNQLLLINEVAKGRISIKGKTVIEREGLYVFEFRSEEPNGSGQVQLSL